MDSLLSGIVVNDSLPELIHLKNTIQNVSDKIILLKQKIKEQMDSKYVQYVPIIVENEEILQNTNDLVEDINQLLLTIDSKAECGIEELTGELAVLKESLIYSSTMTDLLSDLCKTDQALTLFSKNDKLKNYYETAKCIVTVSKFLNKDCRELEFLDIYQGMIQWVSIKKDTQCREAIDRWRECVIWSKPLEFELDNKQTQTSLCVSSEKNVLEDLLKTLEIYDMADQEIEVFGDKCLKLFIRPIIKSNAVLTRKINGNASEELTILCSPSFTKPVCKEVIHNLTIIFQFLEDMLKINMHETTFITRLGKNIADEFLNILIDECLNDTIPESREDLKNFTPQPLITNFQTQLLSIGFITESNTFLDAYAGNIEYLFQKKTFEKYINTAKLLFVKDLHELKVVGDMPAEKDLNALLCDEKPIIEMDKICPNLLKFPLCSISQSVEELIFLIQKILNEGLESDKFCSGYINLARDIINMYPDAVLLYHRRLLTDIPQYSALLYNNLLYMAHKIMVIIYDKKIFDNKSNSSIIQNSCFIDLILPFKNEAGQILGQQVQNQQNILLELLNGSGFSSLSEYDKLPESTEKSIRACLRQLLHLKAIWTNVLPANVYAEVIGGLCSFVINEITTRIVTTTELKADVTRDLVKVLSHFRSEAPNVFEDPKEVYQHIQSWPRLNELILLLGAPLTEISERWADGKGPLANEFTVQQVKQMIKALFKASDSRAVLLTKIK